MIHLLFIFTIISGLIQETNSVFSKQTDKYISMMYAIGSIFFIFWHEQFIDLALIWGLFILSIVDFIIIGKDYQKKVKKINNYFCLIILIGLFIKYLLYFI